MFPTFSLKGKWEKKEWRRNNCKQREDEYSISSLFFWLWPLATGHLTLVVSLVISMDSRMLCHLLPVSVCSFSCYCIYCLVTWLFMSFIFTWQLDYLTCCVTLSRLFSYTLGSFQIRVEVWLVTKILGDGKDLSQQSIYLACHILT